MLKKLGLRFELAFDLLQKGTEKDPYIKKINNNELIGTVPGKSDMALLRD